MLSGAADISATGQAISIALAVVVLALLIAFQVSRGHPVLAMFAVVLPILWLVGFVVPARPGSWWDRREKARWAERDAARTAEHGPDPVAPNTCRFCGEVCGSVTELGRHIESEHRA